MIEKSIFRAFQEKYKRDWDKLYFAIDLHGTIIHRYKGDDILPYDWAEETLYYLSKKEDIVLILFTSSYPQSIMPFNMWCKDNDIKFKYLNRNPECPNNKTGDFTHKFYFNVLIDGRAGFDPDDGGWNKIFNAIEIAEKMEKCVKIKECIYGLNDKCHPYTCKNCKKLSLYDDDVHSASYKNLKEVIYAG